MFDPQLYRDKSEVEEWKARDPIPALAQRLQRDGSLTEAGLADLEREVAREVEAAVAFAEAGAWEPVEELTRFVYREEGVS